MSREMDKQMILVVDDEPGIRKVLGIYLSDMGYDILEAQNGEEAFKMFQSHKPEIVLSDIKMPGMDGIDLLQAIKKEEPETEVIMITGHGDIDLAIKSLKHEATDFITKPIDGEILAVALKRARDRMTMRRQLRQYTESLEQLVAEKTEKLLAAERFSAVGHAVAGLSHTIKNITSGLKGGVFVLEKGLNLEEKKYLDQGWDMIRRNVEKITKLSMELLNFTRTSEIHCVTGRPNQPVEEVFGLMSSIAAERQVTLKKELAHDVLSFLFDPEAILSCLLNLVSNAIDACCDEKAGCGDKQVVIRTLRRKGWGIEYQVADNGSGMPKDVLDCLFKRFFSTKGNDGTGIGLMMTKNIVDKHGGEIAVISHEGQGTTVVIRLPG